MSDPGKGGRGKQAPYATIHYRIPEPIKPTVERFASAYRILVSSENSEVRKKLIDSVDDAISSLGEMSQKVKDLETDLSTAKSEIEFLKAQNNNIATELKTVLQLKSRDGTKMKKIISELIENLTTN